MQSIWKVYLIIQDNIRYIPQMSRFCTNALKICALSQYEVQLRVH